MAATLRVANQTNIGSSRAATNPGILLIDTPAGTASGIVLQDSAGTEYVLWVDTTGDLMIGTRANFATPDAAGTVVGGQS
jgi:hypothetical protein